MHDEEYSFEPPDDLVTIGEVDSPSEFLIVRSLLESADIDCYSPNFTDYYVKGKNAGFSIIPVQVRASQAQQAIALLKDAEAHPTPEVPDGEPQP